MSLLNGISYPPYCFNVFRLAWRLVHFLSQPSDVGHYCIVVAFKIFLAPNSFKQFFCRDNPSVIFAKIPQNVELKRCQRKKFSIQRTPMTIAAYIQPLIVVFYRFHHCYLTGIILLVSTQLGFYPRNNFQGVKRLRDSREKSWKL